MSFDGKLKSAHMQIVNKFKSLHKDSNFDSSMSVCLKYFSVNSSTKYSTIQVSSYMTMYSV